MIIRRWNVEKGYAVFSGAFIKSDKDEDLERWREKVKRSRKPALEIIQDGFTTIGIVTVFERLTDVPKGVEFYTLT